MSASAVAQLKSRNPNIAYCEQDQEVDAIEGGPFDFRIVGRPSGSQPVQSVPWGVTRVHGGTGTGAGSGTAWVIDTGINLSHPDLNVDAARSRNFSNGNSPEDGNGHGSHVAGIIGAKDNSIGVVGVSPGATLVAVRVLNNAGSGTNSDVIAGVNYVAANGHSGDVANMSLGGGVSQALDQAVVNAAATGVKFTLAAGNESDSATNHSPARANGPNVYTVSAFAKGTSATDTDDPWASYSNFGNPPSIMPNPGRRSPRPTRAAAMQPCRARRWRRRISRESCSPEPSTSAARSTMIRTAIPTRSARSSTLEAAVRRRPFPTFGRPSLRISIAGQRSMTTLRPAASARAAASSLMTPSCIHTALAPAKIA